MGKAVDPATLDDSIIYSGAQYRASISFWYYDHPTGGKGISSTLNGVMKVADGENLSGRVSVADNENSFAEFAGEAVGMGTSTGSLAEENEVENEQDIFGGAGAGDTKKNEETKETKEEFDFLE